jgi:hypothetical protein
MKILDYGSNDKRCNEHVRCSLASFSGIEKQALYKAIISRRDARSHLSKARMFQRMFLGEF